MLSDLQLVYMVPRNSTQLLNINTTKFQVEREPVYNSGHFKIVSILTFDSLTGSWSVWPHVVTPQWLIKKIYFLPIYIITLVEKNNNRLT